MCDSSCMLCIGPTNTNCTTCAANYYQLSNLVSNATVGAYQCHFDPYKTLDPNNVTKITYNPCPNGYYGIQNTMMCQSCPIGCLTCNIFL